MSSARTGTQSYPAMAPLSKVKQKSSSNSLSARHDLGLIGMSNVALPHRISSANGT